jgi:hypothetical protein
MRLYTFYGDDGTSYFATLREAVAAARVQAADPEWDMGDIEIERHTVTPLTTANFIEILNTSGGCWSAGF